MGFEARDLNLPVKRDKLIQKIEEDLIKDNDVIGLFYGGSIGSGQTDLYSDIDLRVVVTDISFQRIVHLKEERAKLWGDVLFFERSPIQSFYTVVHYRSFVKVDCFYYRINDLKASLWMKDIKIAYDPTCIIKGVKNASTHHSFELTKEDFLMWQGKLFAYFHESYRRTKRKEWSYSQSMILGLKWLIAAGWYMEKDLQPNSFGDGSKMEGERSHLDLDQLKLLEIWSSCSAVEQKIETIMGMATEAKRVYKSLCVKANLIDEINKIDEVMELIV